MPSGAHGAPGANRPSPGAPTGLPPVLRDENPSEVILKYMDGILKRSQKINESWIKVVDIAYIALLLTNPACIWAPDGAADGATYSNAVPGHLQLCSWQAN